MTSLSTPLDEFKEREIEIINLMADGLSNKEIADQLFITKETVRWYNKQIYSKLGTSRRTEAIALAREMGLIGDVQATTNDYIQHKLPLTTGPFVGRDKELEAYSDLIQNPEIRLLSIVATGGMGKSRCALELGHLVKSDYEHGAVFIDLSPVRNPDDIAKNALISLGVSIHDKKTPQEILLNYCREKELLLIFDNFEHMLSGASLLTDILEIAPKVTIIATSRERLNLRAETTVYLEPVIEDGDKLFIEIATMMRPYILIEEQDLTEIQHIVELVGGLPLAIVLAVTWIDTLTVHEIAEEIKTSLDFLSADMGDMPDRQRSIHAVVDPTWKRLKPVEQRAFMWASVFRGGFTRKTFQKLTGASIRTLQTLQNRSLIYPGQKRRYDMHPLLRQYARERLDETGLLDEAKLAHLKVFTEYAQTQREKMYSGHYLESLDALDMEQDNFRTALDWSFSGHDIEMGTTLIIALAKFWLIRSQLQEAIHYIEQALKYQHNAELHMNISFCLFRMGEVDKAKENIHEAIALAEETQSLDILANSYRILATLSIQDKPPHEIQEMYETALELAETSEESQVIAACHASLGMFLSNMGSLSDIVFEHFQKELEIWESLGDLLGISRTIYNMALEHNQLGNRQRARELCEESLKIKQQIGDKAGIARRLSVLATWDIVEEELERASSYLAESRIICEELGEQPRLVYTLATEGFLHIIKMETQQAHTLLQRGLKISQTIKDTSRFEEFHSYLALLYLLQGDVDAAKPHILETIQAHPSSSNSWLCIVAYVQYLWHINDLDACVAVASVAYHHVDANSAINHYFLQPLFYRIEQKIGEDNWHDALTLAEGMTIEELYQRIVADLKIN